LRKEARHTRHSAERRFPARLLLALFDHDDDDER
jgi:hypothetical protein